MKTVWDRHGQTDSRKLVSFLNQRDLVKRAFTSLSYCCFHHPGASIPHRESLLRRGSHWMFQSSSTSTQSSRSLEQEGTDKYLEVSEGDRVQHSLKEKIRKEYYPRIRMVLKSDLNSPTKLEAINTLAVPMVTYSFNIMNWTRNFLTKYKMHHPKSDIDRLYLPRTEGDRELMQQEPLSILLNTSRRRRIPSSTLSKTMTAGNPCPPSADSQWSSVGNWKCL